MRICVDLTSLADNFSGIERFALSITKELIENKNHCWILIFKNCVPDFINVSCKNVETVVVKGNNKLFFNQLKLPLKLQNIDADRYFFPAFPAPFFFFKKGVYNTIHDLSCWDCPNSNKWYMIIYFKLLYWKATRCNKRIVTVSHFSKERICAILKTTSENVAVIYNGIGSQFTKTSLSEKEKRKLQEKYFLPKEYVLCLSTLEPRKNLRLLLDAYFQMYKGGLVEELVLAGRKGWMVDDFLHGYDDDFVKHIHFTGFISDEDLPGIYKMAKVFIFPSLYEGFGIPPLEALSCGTPVISSNASAMPEVLSEYASYFESNKVEELIKSIKDFYDGNMKCKQFQNEIFRWDKQAGILTDFMTRDYCKR